MPGACPSKAPPCHNILANRRYVNMQMPSPLVDATGTIGAVLTTACWLPQASKIIRDRDTRAISLGATAAFTVGIGFWLIYGLALVDWPLIVSNIVTLLLMIVILALKLRHG
jgi:MtN3 and saliva related transmembrane protein